MKAKFSEYLNSIAPSLKELIRKLREDFDYVSILATDSTGWTASIGQHVRQVNNDTMTTERGNVVRVYKNGLYSEYSFNVFDPENIDKIYREILHALLRQFELLQMTNTSIFHTQLMADTPRQLFVEMETGSMPEDTDLEAIVKELSEISAEAMHMSEDMIDCRLRAQSTHISKMFLTELSDMRQSYVYSEGMILPILSKDGQTKYSYNGVSGRSGAEIFGQLRTLMKETVDVAKELMTAEQIEPGEYDIITSPEVTGLIAHEAFGHGVEMDMFVKKRALGAQYIDQRVGSDLVTMHEGALCAEGVTSFAFDDEGTLAGDVIEIDHGILRTGICDALSALRLNTHPTGNGKRENFEHKVYTRMTNTVFDSGTDTLEDMIASIQHGYFLNGMQSGMEDPKHWGIQCIIERGYEIKDGKLTGKVVSPIVMTGYVPDLLNSVSMVSTDRKIYGNGACGKGHKEWVKVTDGGPCFKAKARLG